MMMRPFSDELFPAEAVYEGPRTQDVFQGQENSCTTMGVLNAVESLVHADEEGRGVPVADCLQLSYAFLWRLLKKQSRINVETAVTALGQFGTCLERLYPYATEPNYPYRVTTLDQDPSALAWADAANRRIKLDIETVSGKFVCCECGRPDFPQSHGQGCCADDCFLRERLTHERTDKRIMAPR